MAEQSSNLLSFNNKQENNGVNNRGRLTAHEFNQVVDAVNNNSNDVFALQKQVGNLSLSLQENEDAYENLTSKDENTIYLILEE